MDWLEYKPIFLVDTLLQEINIHWDLVCMKIIKGVLIASPMLLTLSVVWWGLNYKKPNHGGSSGGISIISHIAPKQASVDYSGDDDAIVVNESKNYVTESPDDRL